MPIFCALLPFRGRIRKSIRSERCGHHPLRQSFWIGRSRKAPTLLKSLSQLVPAIRVADGDAVHLGGEQTVSRRHKMASGTENVGIQSQCVGSC